MLRKRVISAILLCAVVLPLLAAGQPVYTAPKEAIDKIRDEGLNRSQVIKV